MGDARINGKQLLSAFTIPGTHNSHATSTNIPFPTNLPIIRDWVICQAWGVRKQLDVGVRFVDLRVGTGFKMVHGRSDLNGTLWNVIDEINGFLHDHPSETVVVSIKWDEETLGGTVIPEPSTFGPDMDKMTRERGSWYTGTTIPTLDDVRGKTVLVRRFGNSSLGLELDHQIRNAQGGPPQPGLEPREQLWAMARPGLEWVKAQPTTNDTIWLTWFSGYDTDKSLKPWDFAWFENEQLVKYLDEKSAPRAEKLGLVIVDFVDQLYTPSGRARDSASLLVEKLLITNFD